MSNANVNAPVPAIEISGLKKYFPLTSGAFNAKKGSVKAVDDINLTINKGEIIGLAPANRQRKDHPCPRYTQSYPCDRGQGAYERAGYIQAARQGA